MIYLVVLADAVENVRDTIRFEYCLASSSGWKNIRCDPFEALYGKKCRFPVLWVEIRDSSLIRPELVQETTNKVVLIKEKLKAARDRQKSYADKRRKPLEFEVGDRILERIGLVAYRLRLPEELNSVHDTFHVLNLKKYLADAKLHVPLDEIKVDKTLRFVEEPVEIMDRERVVKSLRASYVQRVTGYLKTNFLATCERELCPFGFLLAICQVSSSELRPASYSNSDDIHAAGFDTRPPMIDKTDYDSWSQRIWLYCRGKENGIYILQLIDHGPFELGTTRDTLRTTPEGGVLLGPERPRTYDDLNDNDKK
ncbi:hypothetical protein Tco_1302260 [Tanacetum coccineum]